MAEVPSNTSLCTAQSASRFWRPRAAASSLTRSDVAATLRCVSASASRSAAAFSACSAARRASCASVEVCASACARRGETGSTGTASNVTPCRVKRRRDVPASCPAVARIRRASLYLPIKSSASTWRHSRSISGSTAVSCSVSFKARVASSCLSPAVAASPSAACRCLCASFSCTRASSSVARAGSARMNCAKSPSAARPKVPSLPRMSAVSCNNWASRFGRSDCPASTLLFANASASTSSPRVRSAASTVIASYCARKVLASVAERSSLATSAIRLVIILIKSSPSSSSTSG